MDAVRELARGREVGDEQAVAMSEARLLEAGKRVAAALGMAGLAGRPGPG